ncbi:UNVERIFIED_CONTAM: Alkane hydroxylase MAH1 [Sesamum radiatum]|uniref:Alkane hydroxylase MAH1 n=1 Tax=Sesamum radiatum TaxID=300843 RepID=A0AAW2LRK4_SESRA
MHFLPESIWKAFHDFIYPLISSKEVERERDDSLNVLTAFRRAYEENNNISFSGDLRQFLRDSMLGLLFAGRDTTSTCLTWLFWLISTNPSAQTKIREEIERELHVKEGENWRFFGIEESAS